MYYHNNGYEVYVFWSKQKYYEDKEKEKACLTEEIYYDELFFGNYIIAREKTINLANVCS